MYTVRICICIALDYQLHGFLINICILLTILPGRQNHASFISHLGTNSPYRCTRTTTVEFYVSMRSPEALKAPKYSLEYGISSRE